MDYKNFLTLGGGLLASVTVEELPKVMASANVFFASVTQCIIAGVTLYQVFKKKK